MQNMNRPSGLTWNQWFYTVFFVYLFMVRSFGVKGSNSGIVSIIIPFSFFFLCIFKKRFSQKELFFVCVIIFYSLVSFYFSRKIALPLLAMTIVGMKNIDIFKLLKVLIPCQLVVFGAKFIGYLLNPAGSIESVSRVMSVGETDVTQLRNSLGFGHPNQMHLKIFTLIATFILVRKGKLSVQEFVFLELVNLAFYFVGYSRTGFILTTTLLIATLFFNWKVDFGKCMRLLLISVPVIAATITIWSAKNYLAYPFLRRIDYVLSHRLALGNYIYMQHPPTLLGQKFDFTGSAIIDSGYLELWLKYGVLTTCLLIAGYCLTIRWLLDHDYLFAVPVFLVYTIYSMIEPNEMNPFINISLLFMGVAFYGILKVNRHNSSQQQVIRSRQDSNDYDEERRRVI